MNTFALDVNIVPEQISILYLFGRSYIYYKEIKAAITSINSRNPNFLIHTLNNNILMSAVSWCQIFGNPKHNKTHWHHTAPMFENKDMDLYQINKEYIETIRRTLAATAKTLGENLTAYTKSFCSFRNKYAAHRDIGNYPPTPFFKTAYAIANSYMSWLQNEVPWTQPTLYELEEEFSSEIREGLLPNQDQLL